MARTILIIEDNDQNLYLMQYLLRQHGFDTIAAQDGESGIELACSMEPPAAILLDIQLPVMDGYVVARELRKCPALDSVPIIAVTSHAMVGDREKVLAAGATDYMEKPIDPDTFVGRLEQYLVADGSSRK